MIYRYGWLLSEDRWHARRIPPVVCWHWELGRTASPRNERTATRARRTYRYGTTTTTKGVLRIPNSLLTARLSQKLNSSVRCTKGEMIPAISLIFLLPTALAAFVTHLPSLCFSPLFSAKMTKIPQLIHQSVVARRKLLTAAASSTSLIPLRMKSSSSCSTLSANDSVNKLHTRNYSTSFSLLSVLSTNAQQKRQGQVLQLASSSQQGGNEAKAICGKATRKWQFKRNYDKYPTLRR